MDGTSIMNLRGKILSLEKEEAGMPTTRGIIFRRSKKMVRAEKDPTKIMGVNG